MVANFKLTSSGAFSANPPTSKKYYVRSSAAETNGLDVTFFGLVGATPTVETITLDAGLGNIEYMTAATFTSLTGVYVEIEGGGATTEVMDGALSIYAAGIAGQGDIRFDSNPADGDTVTIKVGTQGIVYTFKNTLSAATHVLIGATAADTADNLKRAINDNGVDGTNYGNGAASAHPLCTATVSGTVVSLTDKVAGKRSLGWTLTQSGSALTLRNFTCGEEGVLVATLAAGSLATPNNPSAFSDIDLGSNADLGDDNVPLLLDGQATDAIRINGRPFTIRVLTDAGTGAIEFTPQFSEDGTTWEDFADDLYAPDGTAETIPFAAADSAAIDVRCNVLQNYEYVRLKCTDPTRTDFAIHAVVIAG